MATALSRDEDLLVVREQQSKLPQMAKLGSFGPDNVVVVAQVQGESTQAFASRVLGRCRRGVARGHAPRTAVVCIDAGASPSMQQARREMLLAIAEILVIRPESEMYIVAPARVGSSDQIALFDLVESLVRATPALNVRLSFGDSTDLASPRRRDSRADRQPAAA